MHVEPVSAELDFHHRLRALEDRLAPIELAEIPPSPQH